MPSPLLSVQFAVLHSLHKDVQPSEFTLKDDICTIGRSATCDIVLTGQRTVSRLHAQIEREGPRYVLRDANSANGTFVNERRISEPHVLQDEDVIGLGAPQAMLRFSDPDPTDVVAGRLYYHARSMKFFLSQHHLDLTPGEFRLLHHLYQHIGDVCTRQSCAEAIWNREYDPGPDDEGLDRMISNIRHKMRQLDPNLEPAEIIKTRRGLGYELALENIL
jgi:DNA-binding response OmpR family regulator